MKVLFVINTFHRGRHVLMEQPYAEVIKRYVSENSNNKSTEHSKINLINIFLNFLVDRNSLLAEIFSPKNKSSTNYIFDIVINGNRFISYPVWIEQNKYRNYKKTKNPTNEDNGNSSDEENLFNVVKLKMFNIVIEFDKKNIPLENLKIIYNVLESFSQFLAFEEYRNEFLGKEISNIFKTLEKMHGEESNDYLEDISYQIAKLSGGENKHKESICIQDRERMSYNNKNENKDKPNLLKIIERFYKDLSNFKFFKIFIDNCFDFKAPAKLLSFYEDIENYHSLIIFKKKNLEEWLPHYYDLNPLIQVCLKNMSPFKNFQEISLELKIPLNFIKLAAKQIHCLNLGKIMKKFSNNTILAINPDMKINKKDTNEHELMKNYNLNLYESINKFSDHKSLNKIFKKDFNQFAGEKFISLVNYLLAHEYLVQCSKYILPKIPFKRKYNTKSILLNNSHEFFWQADDKLNIILNDLDANIEANYSAFKNNIVISGKEIYFEDALQEINKSSPEDYKVLKNFYYFLTPEFNFDQICYLTGYKEDLILRIIKKYKFLFNIIINIDE